MGDDKESYGDRMGKIDRALAEASADDLRQVLARVLPMQPMMFREMRSCDRLPLAFVCELVRPMESAKIESLPLQRPMKLTHLVVSDAVAGAFSMRGPYIGTDMKATQITPMPLDTFAASYQSNERLPALQEWRIETIAPGVIVTIEAFNRTPIPQRFAALFWGLLV